MKSIVGMFVALALCASIVNAESLTVGTMVKDRYLGSNGGYFSEGPVVQTDIFQMFDSGIWVDVWNSQDLGGESSASSYANEVDLGVGYAGAFGDKLSVNVGVYYWDCAKTFEYHNDDIWQVFVELAMAAPMYADELMEITPFIKVESLRDSGNGSVVDWESKFHYGANVKSQLGEKIRMGGKVSFYYDPGIFGVEPGVYVGEEIKITYQLSENVALHPLWVNVVYETETGDVTQSIGLGADVSF